MRLARLKSAAFALVAVAAAACGSESAVSITDPAVSPGSVQTGGAVNFTLQSVNARPLPAEMRRDASGTMSITAGVLSLGSGTFVQTLSLYETTFDGQTSTRNVVTQGTYTVKSGSQIHFQASDGGTWDASYTSTRIEYSVAGNSGPVTFVFVRG